MPSPDTSEVSLELKISELSDENLLNFIKESPHHRLSQNDINYIMEIPSSLYPEIVYYISEYNKVIYWKTFRRTFLYENYNNFNQKDLKYLVEAMKNQIIMGFDDPYYILDYFLKNIAISSPLQRYFTFLTTKTPNSNLHLNFKIREYLITNGILKKY